MREAAQAHDLGQLKHASQIFRLAQETWLQVTQHLSPEQAHAALLDFAFARKLNQWVEDGLRGNLDGKHGTLKSTLVCLPGMTLAGAVCA